jgi:hypothetical protein
MTASPRKFELASQDETERRQREVQLLINVAEPDPEYQAFLLTDEASLLDAVPGTPELIQRRLDFYFGGPLDIPLRTPLWKYVDEVKARRTGWPSDEEWDASHSA